MPDGVRPAATHEHLVQVLPGDIDELGHVNNLVYARWVLDIATEHWFLLSTEEMREGLAWVVRRHELDYLAPAMPGDVILVRTRVGHREGLTYERLTDVLRADDQKPLARSRTLWIPVDPTTGRPKRLPADVSALVSADD